MKIHQVILFSVAASLVLLFGVIAAMMVYGTRALDAMVFVYLIDCIASIAIGVAIVSKKP